MEIKYIILFVSILIIYVLINSIEPFGNNMIGVDSNGANINVPADCNDRTKDQCSTTHGCQWKIYKKAGKEIKECHLKKNLTSGYGKSGVNIHLPSACKSRDSQNCEANLGCTWDKQACIVTHGWLEETNLDGNIVQFQQKCSQRLLNYCMIGPDCFLNGGLCYKKPNTDKLERQDCRIDRRDMKIGQKVNMCRNVRQHWTPEHDKKDDVVVPIPIMDQTKTCWHCPKPI